MRSYTLQVLLNQLSRENPKEYSTVMTKKKGISRMMKDLKLLATAEKLDKIQLGKCGLQ